MEMSYSGVFWCTFWRIPHLPGRVWTTVANYCGILPPL